MKKSDKQAVIRTLRSAAARLSVSAGARARGRRPAKAGVAVSAKRQVGKVFIGLAQQPSLGAWITPDSDVETLSEQIGQVLEKAQRRVPGAQEWLVAAYDDFPDLGENPNLEDLAAIAEALGEHDYDVVIAALSYAGGDVDDALKRLREGYALYDSETAYAEQYVDDVGVAGISNLEWYLDFEKLGRDLLQASEYGEAGDQIVVWS